MKVRPVQNKQTQNRSQLKLYFQIKLTVAVYRDERLIYRNEMTVPAKYTSRIEAQKQVDIELRKRLDENFFFMSPRPEFDIVKYADLASCNTYLKFRLVENLA